MEDNFRNVLIILSTIVIVAIFIHGLWTIRKQKNPYKLKASKDKVGPITRDFDRKGFDQDGVGQVKVKHNDNLSEFNSDKLDEKCLKEDEGRQVDLSQSQVLHKKDIFDETFESQNTASPRNTNSEQIQVLDNSLESDWFKDDVNAVMAENNNALFSKEQTNTELNQAEDEQLHEKLSSVNNVIMKASEAKIEPKKPAYIEPLYEQPVTQAKPARTPIKHTRKVQSPAPLKRDQIEIDFDNQKKEQSLTAEASKNTVEPEVIILSVVMPANQQMFGATLLPSLLTLGLKYGEMNIFHRHEDNAGSGKVTFSLANIMNPGSFDLDSMETFATRGVSLFMTLPNAGNSLKVFEQMLNAAKQLAQEFNAQVLDDKRNVMTKQTEQHYLSQIRAFDRKSHITLVE